MVRQAKVSLTNRCSPVGRDPQLVRPVQPLGRHGDRAVLDQQDLAALLLGGVVLVTCASVALMVIQARSPSTSTKFACGTRPPSSSVAKGRGLTGPADPPDPAAPAQVGEQEVAVGRQREAVGPEALPDQVGLERPGRWSRRARSARCRSVQSQV